MALESQLRDLESNLAGILTSCEFVDRAVVNASSTQLLLVKKQVVLLCFSTFKIVSFQVGEGLKNSSNCEASVPVDTDYVELSLEGFDEVKDSINSIGTLISSSCIPSLSSAGLFGMSRIFLFETLFRWGRIEKNCDWEKEQYFLNHKVLS